MIVFLVSRGVVGVLLQEYSFLVRLGPHPTFLLVVSRVGVVLFIGVFHGQEEGRK